MPWTGWNPRRAAEEFGSTSKIEIDARHFTAIRSRNQHLRVVA
jgi:hypothetical protein